MKYNTRRRIWNPNKNIHIIITKLNERARVSFLCSFRNLIHVTLCKIFLNELSWLPVLKIELFVLKENLVSLFRDTTTTSKGVSAGIKTESKRLSTIYVVPSLIWLWKAKQPFIRITVHSDVVCRLLSVFGHFSFDHCIVCLSSSISDHQSPTYSIKTNLNTPMSNRKP